MAISKNLPLLQNHFRKHWQERVRVHFDQAGKKVSRRQARLAKAAKSAPKPVDSLKPIVRCPTIKYNRKVRAGRGFTQAELAAAGFTTPQYARSVGVSVDHRRKNKSQETFDANVARLNEYKTKLVVFGSNTKASEIAQHEQVSTAALFPIAQPAPESAPRAVEQTEQTAYRTLRLARSDKRHRGIREKRAKEAAEAEADKKK